MCTFPCQEILDKLICYLLFNDLVMLLGLPWMHKMFDLTCKGIGTLSFGLQEKLLTLLNVSSEISAEPFHFSFVKGTVQR